MSARSSSLLSGVVHNFGSFLTSLHTIDSMSAVTFTISLWRRVTTPPVLHVNAWSMLHFALQTHSCLNKTTSKNSRLVNENLSCLVKMIIILKHRLMLLYCWLYWCHFALKVSEKVVIKFSWRFKLFLLAAAVFKVSTASVFLILSTKISVVFFSSYIQWCKRSICWGNHVSGKVPKKQI